MIETERLFLRQLKLEDFPAYHAMNSDPRVMRYIAPGKPASEEDSWFRLLRNAGFWPVLGYGMFALIAKAGGEFCGIAGLARFRRGLGEDFDLFAEAGWTLAAPAHGKGYATEAVSAAHDWFHATHGPQRTVCIIDPDNAPSLGVAAKLGYRAYGEAIYKEKTVIKLERHLPA